MLFPCYMASPRYNWQDAVLQVTHSYVFFIIGGEFKYGYSSKFDSKQRLWQPTVI